MKLLLSLFLLAAFIITVSGQQTITLPSYPPKQAINPLFADTPKPKYHRFYIMRIDTIEYQRSWDTIFIGRSYVGRNLFHEDALFWQEAMWRSFQRINERVRLDSVKIQGGKP